MDKKNTYSPGLRAKIKKTSPFYKGCWDKLLASIWQLQRKCFDACMEVKYAVQRARRGYSDSDSWDIGYWLATVLPPMIKMMRRDKQGVPISFFREFDKDGQPTDSEEAEARYNDMLDEILKGLESARMLDELDYDFRSDSKTYVRKLESEVQKAFALIGKNLNHLWW